MLINATYSSIILQMCMGEFQSVEQTCVCFFRIVLLMRVDGRLQIVQVV
ncbi:unnamed protein product [Schistosoma curassoni]|uniref:Uncharacterized protein n=1 Tax=Schistosoma curassoni TaxID=6186 RepID=A0A183JMJ4_9TREM|nr:unnamed protein product [Schistosoma curassoni]